MIVIPANAGNQKPRERNAPARHISESD